jgi:tetratricopeptide (TPR) repeat protein
MSDRISHFRQKIKENPANSLFKFSLAQLLHESGDNEEAAILFEQCLSDKPNWMMSALFLGKVNIALNNKEQAVKYLQVTKDLAIEQNHDDPLQEAIELLSELQ